MDAAYLCFLLLGTGALLPWNALITAADFWEAEFPGRHTDRLLTATYLPANLAVLAALTAAHGAVRPKLRIVAGLAGFSLALSAVTQLAPGGGALAALLALVAACGVCDGLASGALYGEAAVLAPRYTQALAAGNSVSGVAVSLLRAATKATLPATPEGLHASANLYFAIAAAVCLTCMLLYSAVLPRLAVVQRRRQAALDAALHGYGPLQEAAATSSSAGSGSSAAALEDSSPLKLRRHGNGQAEVAQQGSSLDLELSADDHNSLRASAQQQQQLGPQEEAAPLLEDNWQQGGGSSGLSGLAVARRIWRLALANALTFIVTLSIFPGVLAEDLHSEALGSWLPVILITSYNCADWAGKSLPGWAVLRLRDERAILALALGRALFIPAFALASARQAALPLMLALAGALGCSNGYCCACAMMRAPAAVPPAAAGLAGNLMVLFLVLGLCLGAGASFIWLVPLR